ncbi:hypothetical protein [Aquibacillus saliphilus]|uniref:hypothetical protein n=1 Tax=Aquibacillus saliphilus TaxID=1909422 RepID=UPI001CF08DD3|nr:hypothetical protein [Aquibacillus saliphilus]
MDNTIKSYFENLQSQDKDIRYQAFIQLLTVTEEKVEWAYEVWDKLKDDLVHTNNHRRAIAAQLLANLAKSDPEERMLTDFSELLARTKDERFVTARHCLQSLWKIGIAGDKQKELVVSGLENRFHQCVNEKNSTLIRFDIIQGLRKLYDNQKDHSIKNKALELIETEEEVKYRKKYAAVWKNS